MQMRHNAKGTKCKITKCKQDIMQTGQNTNLENANTTKCKYDKMQRQHNANVTKCKYDIMQ